MSLARFEELERRRNRELTLVPFFARQATFLTIGCSRSELETFLVDQDLDLLTVNLSLLSESSLCATTEVSRAGLRFLSFSTRVAVH